MFDTAIAQFGFHVLLQSTLLIAAGCLAVRIFARHKPVVQSAILRVTLIAVLLCPVASLALNEVGVTEFAMLPAWESPQTTAMDVLPETSIEKSAPVPASELTAAPAPALQPLSEPVPFQETGRFTDLPAGTPPLRNSVSPSPDPSLSSVQPPSNVSVSRSSFPNVGSIVLFVWMTGTVILLAKLILANILVLRLRRSCRDAEGDVQAICRQMSRTLGLPTPQIKTSPHVHSPCLIGIRNPMILLPDGETFSPSVLREVFLHELAHLSRRDCLFHLLARLATAVLFFQPLVWWLSRRLEQIADDICDDYVIQYGQDRKSYAHTLVNFAEQLPMQWTATEAGLGMVSFRSSLSRRVLRILDSTRALKLRLNTGWLVMIVVLGISATTSAALLINTQSATVADNKDNTGQVQTDKPDQVVVKPSDSDRAPAAKSSSDVTEKQAAKQPAEPTFHFQGKVVGPDGKPVQGATINYAHWNMSESPVLATVDDRGEFDFSISPAHQFFDILREDGGTLVAMAEGYGPAVKSAHECETTGELMKEFQRKYAESRVDPSILAQALKKILSGSPSFQLVKDDLPLTGRVIDIDGQPVAGAILKVAKLVDGGRGGLDEWEKKAQQPGTDYYQLQMYQGMNLGNDVGGTTLDYIKPAVTDKNGQFIFKGIGRDRIAKLLISGPGIATSRVYARTRPGDIIEVAEEARRGTGDKIVYYPANFTHVAGPSVPVEGVVRDAKTKTPLAGVTVQSHQLAGHRTSGWTESIVQTVTDDRGRYRLEGLPVGDNDVLCLSSIDEPYIVARFGAETKPGQAVLQKDVELTRGLWIEGRAYDVSTGEPVTGRVEYFAFLSNSHAKQVKGYNGALASTRNRTNEDGTYRIAGLPGRGIVTMMADNHTQYQRGMGADEIEGQEDDSHFRTYPYILSKLNAHVLKEVNPSEDAETVTADLEFDSGRSLEVKVVDADGNPVSGGRYHGKMESMNNWELYVGNTLTIRGYRPEKPRRVQVVHQERKLVGLMMIEGESPENLTVTLEPWAKISGHLLDESGVPKGEVTIGNVYQTVMNDPTAAMLPPNLDQEAGRMVGFETDEDGRFTIEGIVPGKPLRLRVSETRKNGIGYYLGEFSIDAELKPGETRDLGDVQIEPRR